MNESNLIFTQLYENILLRKSAKSGDGVDNLSETEKKYTFLSIGGEYVQFTNHATTQSNDLSEIDEISTT